MPKSATMTRKLPEAQILDAALPSAALAEGPYWHTAEQALYWVDIDGCLLHRRHDREGHEAYKMPANVSFAVAVDDGRLAVGLADGIYLYDRKTSDLSLCAAPQDMPAGNRFNDAKCDPAGNLWAGTISRARKPEAGLYYLRSGILFAQEKSIINSNGLGWSPDGCVMYFNDTARHVTWAYDYDPQKGMAGARRVLIDHGAKAKPDGLCVDTQGTIYCASFSDAAIDMFSPQGKHMRRIAVPAQHVTSCALGGADMRRLFITTAGDQGDSGRIFYVDVDVPGRGEVPLRLSAVSGGGTK